MLAQAISATKPTASMRRRKNLGTSSPSRSSIAGMTADAPARVVLRELALEIGSETRDQILLRLLDRSRRRRRRATAAKLRLPRASGLGGETRSASRRRSAWLGEEELRRHDAHRQWWTRPSRRSVEPIDRGIAGEAPLPEPIAQRSPPGWRRDRPPARRKSRPRTVRPAHAAGTGWPVRRDARRSARARPRRSGCSRGPGRSPGRRRNGCAPDPVAGN